MNIIIEYGINLSILETRQASQGSVLSMQINNLYNLNLLGTCNACKCNDARAQHLPLNHQKSTTTEIQVPNEIVDGLELMRGGKLIFSFKMYFTLHGG